MEPQKKPIILIIEDDPLLSKMYSEKFGHEGFDVVTAADGEAGLAAVRQTQPQVILLDIVLPKRTGIEFLAELRQDQKFASIPVIALSNFANPKEAKKALQLGVKEYLVKAMHTPENVVLKVKGHLAPTSGSPSTPPLVE